ETQHRVAAQRMANQAEPLPIDAVPPRRISVQRGDQAADIVGAITKARLVPRVGLAKMPLRRTDPAGGAAVAGGVAMVGCDDQVTGRGEGGHQEARLCGAAMEPMRE